MIKKVLLIGSIIAFGLALFNVSVGSISFIPLGLLLLAGSFLAD